MEHTAIPSFVDPFPILDSPAHTTTSQHAHDAPTAPEVSTVSTAETVFQVEYEGPLYTEINIPLPRLPRPRKPACQTTTTPATPAAAALTSEKSRGRSKTLSSLSPFRSRRSSSISSSTSSSSCQSPTSPKSSTQHTRQSDEEWPRIRKDTVKSREVNAMMDLRHQSKRSRSGTIHALAVVPAVLVLSAELFTPGAGGAQGAKRKDSGVGRWEDGIR